MFLEDHGKYGFLSNYYKATIKVNGIKYASNEHYFHAMKYFDKASQNDIMK